MELLFTGTRKTKQRTSLKKVGVPLITCFKCEMPITCVTGNIRCTPTSLKFRPDIQAGDINMGVIITWMTQKAIKADEIICAGSVK